MSGKTCRGKRRYRDEAHASDALAGNKRSGRAKTAVRFYYCQRCTGYHLTSQAKRT